MHDTNVIDWWTAKDLQPKITLSAFNFTQTGSETVVILLDILEYYLYINDITPLYSNKKYFKFQVGTAFGQPEALMDNQKLQNRTTPFIFLIRWDIGWWARCLLTI